MTPLTAPQTGDGAPGPFEPPRGRIRRILGGAPTWLIIIAFVAVVVAPAGYFIHIPYYSVGPGPSVDILTLIDVRGAAKTYPSRGKLLLTTASESINTVNLWDALYASIDPNIVLVPKTDVIPTGSTNEEQDIQNQFDMELSKYEAEIAAFKALGFKIPKVPGARVVTVIPGGPADGHLRSQDLIVSLDAKSVAGPSDVAKLLSKHKIGDTVTVGFKRDGVLKSVKLKTQQSVSKPLHPIIGITQLPDYRLPYNLGIDTQRIVGPSGGMMFALAIYDAFTPADLTHGHIIAGTGTVNIDASGRAIIGDIGAIEEKVRTARAQGADIFLAPADQAAAAHKVAPASMKVIGVHTFAEALAILKGLSTVTKAA